MKQFDVFNIDDPGGAVAVVLLQGAFYLDLPSVLVAPLYPAGSALQYTVINPEIRIGQGSVIVKLEQITSVSPLLLDRYAGTAEDSAQIIKDALDRLIGGY
jgi:hypothetical protein